jgi:hypothetical protein
VCLRAFINICVRVPFCVRSGEERGGYGSRDRRGGGRDDRDNRSGGWGRDRDERYAVPCVCVCIMCIRVILYV